MATPVSRYFRLQRSAGTARTYCSAIARFFNHIENPDQELRRDGDRTPNVETLAVLDIKATDYIHAVKSGERDIADDMVDFISHMNGNFAPQTIQVARGALKGFFEENGIEFSGVDRRRIRRRLPRNHSIAEEDTITMDHLRAIVPLLSVKDRAVVLFLLSSGCRIGEALSIRLQDMDLDSVPARVTFRFTKNGERRISFLTPEATESMRAWLSIRREFLVTAAKRTVGLVRRGHAQERLAIDDRVFPFYRASFDLGWAKALERAGVKRRCEDTGRLTLRPHGLRKYFRTHLGAAAGPDVAEVLMGHEGYLETYRRLTEADLRHAYLTHYHVLVVGEGGGDVARQMSSQREQMERIIAENKAMREELAALKANQADIVATTIAVEETPEYQMAVKAALAALRKES